MCPGRERMLLYTRACDSDSFKPEEDHSRAVMEAVRAEHNVDCSTATLSTVLFTDGEPTQLVIGVWTGRSPHLRTRKNDFYHTIDLTTTVLPVAIHGHGGEATLVDEALQRRWPRVGAAVVQGSFGGGHRARGSDAVGG